MVIKPLSGDVAVSPQIRADEIAEVAKSGFRSVVNNRPDGEEAGQPAEADIRAAAEAAGLAYRFIPVVTGALTMENVADFRAAIAELPKPVFAFCRSGTRCANVWALARAGEGASARETIGAAAEVGYDLGGLRRFFTED
ncbi:MAG: TIGR01244 family phosphatase [Hyphomicrobiales bacterium]|nr:TIGR01244 family phosphatase [Hyphomicrobiales bacterium]